MSEEDILTIVCAGALIISAIAVVAFIVLNLKAFTYEKKKEGSETCLTVNAKKNLAKVTVQARFGSEEIKFERKRIRKGQSVDFVYPHSEKKAKLIVEPESGSPQTIEV